jgi:hypothetical protein
MSGGSLSQFGQLWKKIDVDKKYNSKHQTLTIAFKRNLQHYRIISFELRHHVQVATSADGPPVPNVHRSGKPYPAVVRALHHDCLEEIMLVPNVFIYLK